MEYNKYNLGRDCRFRYLGLKKDARLDDKQLQDQINTLKERVDKLESKKGSNNENR